MNRTDINKIENTKVKLIVRSKIIKLTIDIFQIKFMKFTSYKTNSMSI